MATIDAAPATGHSILWYCTTAASLAVGIVPIWVLETWFGVPRKISVGYGILAYVIGTTVLKLPLHHFFVERFLRPRLGPRALAVAQGVLSAAVELAPAAVFFAYVLPQLTWWQLVGFGVGAGATEAIMLPFISNPFKGTSLADHAEPVFRASARSAAIHCLSVLERVWGMLLQVSARGLLGLSIFHGILMPASLTGIGLAAVDGSAYYWHLRKWRFDTLPVLTRVHLLLGGAACALTAIFAWWSATLGFGAG